MSPPSSRSKNKLKRNQPEAVNKQLAQYCYLLHAGLMFGLLFDPEDGCNMFLRKIC
jgi:hypothetical protein